jgi:nucleoside-diphosphate-sugar epimerase
MPAKADRGRVVIAGGTGFLGLSLATHLTNKGWSVAVLSRHAPRRDFPWSHFRWDARTLGLKTPANETAGTV